ncbi:hypothetical protein JHN61_04775 [Streptomyces sp. MBT67]|uniref:hypothetical protein n=1 Tax=unclassified Streptomyces TaxID=2593676 RepID=UPI00190A7CE9|nr:MULTISPECIES: hypothetical protein [unclassified Streptomyces]MBK3528269.1 hypothetical protein [Streptomyces sp. MBT72]MBK3535540.1 hypothetical protein [Streptomyces sp. MBT67]MBK3549296.1 hypothetical protein [Streptomyces sp. MBT61]MBK6028235.1 hypothetical protein [Streptomyces sp. MBT59]
MSRTQWWSLTALLAVVLGLLCGPGAVAAAGPGASAPVAHVVQGPAEAEGPAQARAEGSAPDRAQHRAQAPAHAQAQTQAQAQAQAQTLAAEAVAHAHAPVAEASGGRAPVPGCGKLRDHDGEPAVPSRARSAHDHAPGLAPWGLPVATGALPAEPPPGIRARAPLPYTPTPVELSVLRV